MHHSWKKKLQISTTAQCIVGYFEQKSAEIISTNMIFIYVLLK